MNSKSISWGLLPRSSSEPDRVLYLNASDKVFFLICKVSVR